MEFSLWAGQLDLILQRLDGLGVEDDEEKEVHIETVFPI